jgi:hypothetical protein
VVVLTHIAETVHLFPAMGWGNAQSVGRYLDLSSAIRGIALLSVGFLLRVARR